MLRRFWKKSGTDQSGENDLRAGRPLRLVLHVGPHKTGTTSLQSALLHAYGAEKPQRIWYPAPTEFGPGHAAISWAVLGRNGFTEQPVLRHRIEEALQSRCQILILSSEGFAHAYPDHFAILAEQTSNIDTHILITLSPIGHRAVSVWQERVKTGRRTSLDDTEQYLDSAGLAPDLTACLARSFPNAKISIIIGDRESPADLYAFFSRATGIPSEIPRSLQELAMNRGLGVVEIEILRGLNIARVSANLTNQQYRRARGLLRKLFDSDKWRSTTPSVPLEPPKKWITSLKKRCAETMQQLRDLESQHRVEILGKIESLDDVTGAGSALRLEDTE